MEAGLEEKQLFDDISRPILRLGDKKTKRYLLALSFLLHLAIIAAWLIGGLFTHDHPYVPKPAKAFSTRVYFYNDDHPPPPPLGQKITAKKPAKPIENLPKQPALLSTPVETPEDIKPESTVIESKGNSSGSTDTAEKLPDNVPKEKDGAIGGAPGGIPGGTPDAPPPPEISSTYKRPLTANEITNPPKRIKYVHPEYPWSAIRAKKEGLVIVEAVIGRDGKIKEVRIIQSSPQFDTAAVDAVKKWEYTRTIVDGEAREVLLIVRINFVLQ